jgi:pyruvate/2-oxoglutarate dehydrogenase complex dihydrolipoamide acyltransferase (E2) component
VKVRIKERTMRELLNTLFAAAAERGRAGGDSAGRLARFAVVGAFVFGVLHAPAEVTAQAQKAGAVADTGASRTAAKAVGGKAEGNKVNMGPIKAFLARARRLNEQGKLDLSGPRVLTVEGDRQEDGTLTNVSVAGESASNAEFKRVAEDFVSSLNESRALAFLTDVSHVRMSFTLDGERFQTETAADAPSEARAAEMARGYRVLVNAGRLVRRGTDEGALLNRTKVSSNGKQLLMTFDMPREQLGNILLRQITPN